MIDKQRDTLQEVIVRPFEKADQQAARHLILEGLGQHFGFIDETKNPDLDDITAYYQRDFFVVALLNQEVVGTGALIHEANNLGRIVRMSVVASLRRLGIGRRILDCLLKQAHISGYHRVLVETTETWAEVIQFWQAYGFRQYDQYEGDIHFFIDLNGPL